MLCHFSKKILTIGLFIFCSVLCSQLFVSSSFAIDDYSVTAFYTGTAFENIGLFCSKNPTRETEELRENKRVLEKPGI